MQETGFSMVRTSAWRLMVVCLPLLVMGCGVQPSAVEGKSIHVDAAGAGDEKGTLVAPFRTVAKALQAAGEGDTIRIAAGTYAENLVVDKPRLNLVGAGREKTVIEANKGCGFKVKADGVSIANLGVQNAGKEAAVYMEKCRGVKVSGCAVSDSPTYAFRCARTSDVEIRNNVITACKSGVLLVTATRCTMTGNTMKKCRGALSIRDRPDCIDGDKPENYQHVIDESNTFDGKVIYYRFKAKNETIENRDMGFLQLAWCEKMTLRNLTFNKAPGAYLVQTHDSTIEKNTFTDCPNLGMYILYSNRNRIENNTFKNNSWGLRFECGEEHTVRNNVFVGNKSRGIAPWHLQTCHLIGNKVSGSEIGIMFKDCILCSAVDNDVSDCSKFGIELATFWGEVKKDNKILNNRIANAKHAIHIWGGKWSGKRVHLMKDTTISGNTIRNCEIGVYIAWVKDSTVSDHTFIDVKKPLSYDATALNTTTTNVRIGTRLKIVVIDAGGRPVADATVTLEGGKGATKTRTATTGKDGRAELDVILEIKKTLKEVVSCGPYTLKAGKGKATSASVAVDPKKSRNITLKLAE